MIGGDSVDSPYDAAVHIRQLAKAHMGRRDRQRVRTSLSEAHRHVRDDETVLLVTDAYLDDRDAGLCVVTDQRLLFLAEAEGGRVTVDVALDESVHALVSGGTIADVEVQTRRADLRLVEVGDRAWAEEVAAAIEHGTAPGNDAALLRIEGCPRCGGTVELLSETGECPSCSLVLTDAPLTDEQTARRDRIRELSADNLEPSDRRRVATCLVRAEAVGSVSEPVVLLTDALVDDRDGLALVTTARLIFLDEATGGALTHQVLLDGSVTASVRPRGAVADVVITSSAGVLTLCAVGDAHWAQMFADAVSDV